MTALAPDFVAIPIAHRALHDLAAGRPENSRAAIRAAIAAGYGIEVDIQRAADGTAMVFHDYALKRLTGASGTVQMKSAAELASLALIGGSEGIPTLAEVLALIDGQVPLLIEIKDQDGRLGPDVGPLGDAIAADLVGYAGPVAVMSFNPHAIAAFGAAAPEVARGLVTCDFSQEGMPIVPAARRAELAPIADFERVGASFVSHDARDPANPHVAALKARGVPVLCWTVRTPEAETKAREFADNITFEGYRPALLP